ncbi:MAG: 16S rRNA pseudouridine516 synthase [Halioglobus sp.]|jgi:16S rRNA pseudouridine516 synthase
MPRLDRFISSTLKIPRKEVRLMLAQRRVQVDGITAADMSQVINAFSKVRVDGETIQDETPQYVMLNKPAGVVSATSDEKHTTALDLIEPPLRSQLHIVGRLDFNSTGLLLLTNDGVWSRQLSWPENKLVKRYRVTVQKPLTHEHVEAFERGIYFKFEGITTRPAQLEILSDFEAEVGLVEGRYHQIKRMFGRFDNKVLDLHRYAVGGLILDTGLAAGASRPLTKSELAALDK